MLQNSQEGKDWKKRLEDIIERLLGDGVEGGVINQVRDMEEVAVWGSEDNSV